MPTHDPDLTFRKLLPSVRYITELTDCATWLINFNGLIWNSHKIKAAVKWLEDYGFKVNWTYTGLWGKPIKVLNMREQCAAMLPNADLYLFIDDDFRFVEKTDMYPFSSGQRYLHSIDYMTRFPKCGVLNTKSFLGGTPQKLKIIPVKDDMVATGQGLFLRNMRPHEFNLWPDYLQDMRGGLEEQTACYIRSELGYFTAKQMNNPTVHITGKLSNWNGQLDDFHNTGVIDANLAGWIRKRYSPEWAYQKKRIPPKLWQIYLDNGGIELTDALIVDYAEHEEWDSSTIGDASVRRTR